MCRAAPVCASSAHTIGASFIAGVLLVGIFGCLLNYAMRFGCNMAGVKGLTAKSLVGAAVSRSRAFLPSSQKLPELSGPRSRRRKV